MAATLTTSATIARLFSSSTTTAAASLSSSSTRFSTKPLSSTHSISPLSISSNPTFRPRSRRFSTTISATISVGDKLPESTFSCFANDDDIATITVSDLTKGKKAIIFAVPGAFTPTCSQKHLPGFVEKASELKAKGVDVIACIAVNDAFVLKAWKKDLGIGDDVMLLSDGNGDFTRAIGAELDLSDKPIGLGKRSRRYSLLAEDGVVKVLNMEEGGAFTSSGAEDMLKAL